MPKNLLTYTFLLIGFDLFFALFIHLVQGHSGELIMISIGIRVVFLKILFIFLGTLLQFSLRRGFSLLVWGLTTVLVYLIVPVIVYLLKENDKGLWQVYLDLHLQSELFIFIFLPYVLASFVSLLVYRKRFS